MRIFAALSLLTLATALHAQDAATYVTQQTPALVEIYKDLHAHPELSHHEQRTSAILAKGLREAGYTVTEHVGVYPDGSHAFGVAGILKDGPGQTLLIRGDMDALPIIEETDGLKQIADGVSLSAGLPPEKAATVTVLDGESTPVEEKRMGSEDVGVFGMSADLKRHEIPVAYFRLGAMDPVKFAAATNAGKPLPGLHTSRFEPLPQPTIETGVTAMTAVGTALLQ